MYQSKFGPTYKVSYSTSVGLLTVTVATMCLTWFLIHRQDKKVKVAASVEEGLAESSGEKSSGR